MNENKPANPLAVVLLIVGIVGALGFALYRALGPAGAPPSANDKTASKANGAAPEKTAAASRPVRQPLAGEDLAVGTNPFGATAKTTAMTTPTKPTTAPRQPASGPLPAPLMISRDRAQRAQALNAFTASDRSASVPRGLPAPSTQPMPVSVEPELVGTLMGGNPTAVFKSDKAIVMVPQGGVYMGWRILRVSHSEATVWNGGATLRLRVGAPSAPATRSASGPQPPQDYATADMIVVHYRSLPAPTRQDLVYGRIEDPAQYGHTDEPQPAALPDEPEQTALPENPPGIVEPERNVTIE